MIQLREHYHDNLSLRLSEVLNDIGVNMKVVKKKRDNCITREAIMTLGNQLNGKDATDFLFGSQSEGSTTSGLKSDYDVVYLHNNMGVIQHLNEKVPGKLQFLMTRDGTTFPGHCLLQAVNLDVHRTAKYDQGLYLTDSKGRVFITHSWLSKISHQKFDIIRHGPALTHSHRKRSRDLVVAFPCASWPTEALPWLHRQCEWPTKKLKRDSVNDGCIVVPVASKSGKHEKTEWRISTARAERRLMFSLNISQLRCYILMKMIIKIFVEPKCKDVVSSYVCKTVLFWCISNSKFRTWNEFSLLLYLKRCLTCLTNCLRAGICPHFIIPANNLLYGKLSAETKEKIINIMLNVTTDIETTLLNIPIDSLGQRLRVKLGRVNLYSDPSESFMEWLEYVGREFSDIMYELADETETTLLYKLDALSQRLQSRPGMLGLGFPTEEEFAFEESTESMVNIQTELHTALVETMKKMSDLCPEKIPQAVSEALAKMYTITYLAHSMYYKVACSLLVPYICTFFGSHQASTEIGNSSPLSPETLEWFSLGIDSDRASSRLKLASALYCSGVPENCTRLLESLEEDIKQTSVRPLCLCKPSLQTLDCNFQRVCFEESQQVLKENIAGCLMFSRHELNCVPVELKYEMFRSTPDEAKSRSEDECWMDWAVVDCRTFFYFLQYKVNDKLKRFEDKEAALNNLFVLTYFDPSISHKDTTFNLLGQCMEQENRYSEALPCYKLSLKQRTGNNAARWHICRLLAKYRR